MKKDKFTRTWIIENSVQEIKNYARGVLTLRGLHYRLVSRGMTNTVQHYKRVVAAMKQARWEGLVSFYTFSDHDREVLGFTSYGETTIEDQQRAAENEIWDSMNTYNKNMWENQDVYIEVWIEKKALQGTFDPICRDYDVALAPCKGYPSLTFLNDAKDRFKKAEGSHETKILYFGDYDPSGEDIPRSIKENLYNLGVDVNIDRILLLEHQVIELELPPAPAKTTDSRTAKWNGLGQVEIDAIEPKLLQKYIKDAILENRDEERYDELMELEESERTIYKANLKDYVKTL